MSSSRSFLFAALALVGFMLWQAWEQDYGPKPPAPENAANSATPSPAIPSSDVADAPQAIASTPTTTAKPTTAETAPSTPAQRVIVQTDLVHAVIDSTGATLAQVDLLAYPQDPNDKTKPVRLLDDQASSYFVAQSGLIANDGIAPGHRAPFSVEHDSYTLAAGANTLEVPFTWQDPSGIQVRKVYIFKRGSYLIETRQEVRNAGAADWSGYEYRQLQRAPLVIAGGGFSFNNPEKYAFAGGAWYTPQDKFNKLAFDKFQSDKLCSTSAKQDDELKKCSFEGGWVAMLQHYFFAAWIPLANERDVYEFDTPRDAAGHTRYLIRTISPTATVGPNQAHDFKAYLYVGPTLESQLAELEKAGIAQKLSLTQDYGYLSFIAEPFHWILLELHALVGNWGLAIILLVLLIKLAMFKLSESQFRSMAKMRKLQPRMEALKERYGDDRQKLSQAQMELYQKEKINPLGGCLPTLIQIPVFFALYYVLLESVELRQAPFFGWIHNLSAPDPYFILPILNAAIMGASTWFTPTSPGMDPMQARMMKVMPLMFAVLFLFFPAGLVLYYTVNGGLSLLQQWVINRRMQAAETKAR